MKRQWLQRQLWFPALVLVGALWATGCVRHFHSGPAVRGGSDPAAPSVDEARRQRAEQLPMLHETARDLLSAHGAEQRWVERGLVGLPQAACESAVGWRSLGQRRCTLIAIGNGSAAVLVISHSELCEQSTCLERSWVFLSKYPRPLRLPARRAIDYPSLSADFSRERAQGLWIAGFRGQSASRLADAGGALPSIASYQSCTLSPDGRELVCRSSQGAVVALDPRRALGRIVASIAQDVQAEAMDQVNAVRPVWWTERGEMAVPIRVRRHPLCGRSACTLVALAPWPAEGPTQLVPTRLSAQR